MAVPRTVLGIDMADGNIITTPDMKACYISGSIILLDPLYFRIQLHYWIHSSNNGCAHITPLVALSLDSRLWRAL